MGNATTIVFARADLSIPGAPLTAGFSRDQVNAVQRQFFDLIIENNPDIIVLDFSAAADSAIHTIESVRRCCAIPILVACEPADPATDKYRLAGAADCIFTPLDILLLHRAIERVLGAPGRPLPPPCEQAGRPGFGEIEPRRSRNAPGSGLRPS